MQMAELAATIVDLPVAVLANNAEKANTRSSHILKMVDDLLVIAQLLHPDAENADVPI